MKRLITVIFVFLCQVTSLSARPDAATERLVDALQLRDLFEVMAQEGQAYGQSLDVELLGGHGGANWAQSVAKIYDPSRVLRRFVLDLEAELPPTVFKPVLGFVETPLAAKIFKLEVAARRALLDKTLEQSSLQMLQVLRGKNDPRIPLLTEFIETNDLIEFNVMGALNANLSFYQGLIEGGAIENTMSERQILQEVWGQEAEIRTETDRWIYSYLAMAYEPLSDEELLQYIDFSRTEAGRALNSAIFASFDRLYKDISFQLGLSVAASMKGNDL